MLSCVDERHTSLANLNSSESVVVPVVRPWHPALADLGRELTRDEIKQGNLGGASEFGGGENVRVEGEESLGEGHRCLRRGE